MPENNLPPCCFESQNAALDERLYVAYMNGGPPERAGLDWRGEPCPTWAELLARAEQGDVGAAGVVAKWGAVAKAAPSGGTSYIDARTGAHITLDWST